MNATISTTTANTTYTVTSAWMTPVAVTPRVTRHMRRARRAWDILDRLCALTGHVGGCGLLNGWYYPGICVFGRWTDIDTEFCVPNPFYRLVRRIHEWQERS